MKIDWSGRSHNFSSKDISYLVNVIKKADPLTQGKYLKKFESNLSKYLNVKNVFTLSSAAAALEVISILLNIKKNEEIIIPAHTYCASAIPFARNGAKILWADINIETRVVDIEDILKKISSKTKAIVVVHLYGFAFDIAKLTAKEQSKTFESHNNIEDAGISGLKDEAVGEMTMDELEKEVIEKYLIKFKNNRRQTANALNISERTLYRKLKEYEIK